MIIKKQHIKCTYGKRIEINQSHANHVASSISSKLPGNLWFTSLVICVCTAFLWKMNEYYNTREFSFIYATLNFTLFEMIVPCPHIFSNLGVAFKFNKAETDFSMMVMCRFLRWKFLSFTKFKLNFIACDHFLDFMCVTFAENSFFFMLLLLIVWVFVGKD